LGAWLNKNLDKIIIAPVKWFRNKNRESDIYYPKSWRKIKNE